MGREIPAATLTGDISTGTMREITRWGCVQRNKPVRAEELTHLIQSLLTEPRQPTVRAGSPPQAEARGETLRPTIFVVDDDASVREAMRGLLEAEGWSVELYSSGEAFLETYRPGREGCLVVDARMPRMGGLELLEQAASHPGAPIIFVVDDDSHVREAIRAVLEKDGRTVEDYSACEAFLEAYHPGREACLLIDAYLPGMNGLELLAARGRGRPAAGHHDYRPCRHPTGGSGDEGRCHGFSRKAGPIR